MTLCKNCGQEIHLDMEGHWIHHYARFKDNRKCIDGVNFAYPKVINR